MSMDRRDFLKTFSALMAAFAAYSPSAAAIVGGECPEIPKELGNPPDEFAIEDASITDDIPGDDGFMCMRIRYNHSVVMTHRRYSKPTGKYRVREVRTLAEVQAIESLPEPLARCLTDAQLDQWICTDQAVEYAGPWVCLVTKWQSFYKP